MINLWYVIKKLGHMKIDKNCQLCKNTLKMLQRQPLTIDEAIAIMPHYNSYNVITHFHIGRVEKINLKETKIYKDLKED